MSNELQKESEKWFRELIKKTSGKKAGENYTKGNRKALSAGNMLFYKYPNPKTPLKYLKAFDMYPLIILLEKRGNDFFGINTHWIPKPLKETFLKLVITQNKQNIKKDKRLSIKYDQVKEFLHRTGLIRVAYKRYKVNRITGLQYIPYRDWKYQLHLPTEKFVTAKGVSSSDVDQMIKSAISKTKKSKNVRFGSKS